MAQRDARPPFAAIDGAVPLEFSALPTPCYLLDEAALTHNAEILGGLARRTGCKVLLAQKAFSNYDLYPLLAPHLAGTEASGLFEARLGAEEMPGKEVHVFCAAYRADEMDELLRYADHIVFNSPAQLAKFGPVAKAAGKSVGLRINPECSTQDGLPAVGDLLVFGDMAIYTTCKNNTFNGMPLPGIYARKPDGTTRKIVTFGYTDFKCRLGK